MGHIALYLLGIAAITAGNMLTAWNLGRYFTEVRRPVLNFKPFNCRPCFTFWATFVIGWLAYEQVRVNPWSTAPLMAAAIAFINFFIIKSKFKVYE